MSQRRRMVMITTVVAVALTVVSGCGGAPGPGVTASGGPVTAAPASALAKVYDPPTRFDVSGAVPLPPMFSEARTGA
jgi:hypothetical protein